MKKIIALVIAVLSLSLVVAAACAQTVAIVQPMSHTSLDQIRETIVARLTADGYTVVTGNANGDTTALTTLLSNYAAEGIDLLIPIATSTAQAAKTVFEGTNTPIVFDAVSDPGAAGMTGEGYENITGVSNSIPAAEIVKLIYGFQPDCQKIGFLYTSSETNSVSTINAAKAYCDGEGIAYEEASIANLSELQTACETLISRGVDALYTGNDNTIASAMALAVHRHRLCRRHPRLLRRGLDGRGRRLRHHRRQLCPAGRPGRRAGRADSLRRRPLCAPL